MWFVQPDATISRSLENIGNRNAVIRERYEYLLQQTPFCTARKKNIKIGIYRAGSQQVSVGKWLMKVAALVLRQTSGGYVWVEVKVKTTNLLEELTGWWMRWCWYVLVMNFLDQLDAFLRTPSPHFVTTGILARREETRPKIEPRKHNKKVRLGSEI